MELNSLLHGTIATLTVGGNLENRGAAGKRDVEDLVTVSVE